MSANQYDTLVARLLDDELDAEHAGRLLRQIEQNPDRLAEIVRHLELWELYAQVACTQRGADRFVASCCTRVAAAADGDRFVEGLGERLAAAPPTEAERIAEIESRARRQLQAFLAEEERLSASPARPRPRPSRRAGDLLRERLEGFCDALVRVFKVVRALAVAGALILTAVVAVRYLQAARVVATLGESTAAIWAAPPAGPELCRRSLELRQGFAELVFKSGANVLLQAPCRLRLESGRGMFLDYGGLAVRVTDARAGFRVRTANGTVHDLGTEFGVLVREDGQLETQVYEGKVRLAEGNRAGTPSQSRLLTTGQAGEVDVSGHLARLDFEPRSFVRSLPRERGFGLPGLRLDLSDILVGGSGFGTGDPNQRVDVLTGTVSDLDTQMANREQAGPSGRLCPALPCVDYVFSAVGGADPVRVSSQGHVFGDCPETDGGYYPYICNSGFLRHLPGVVASIVLNGQTYGTAIRPVVVIHANAGVTFDLQAVRDRLSLGRLRRFTALCGISETAGIAALRETGGTGDHYAGFWVLVDGEVRFRRGRMQVHGGAVSVSVPLDRHDRFLTLVVTDGGDGHGYDWGAFALPALELDGTPGSRDP